MAQFTSFIYDHIACKSFVMFLYWQYAVFWLVQTVCVLVENHTALPSGSNWKSPVSPNIK